MECAGMKDFPRGGFVGAMLSDLYGPGKFIRLVLLQIHPTILAVVVYFKSRSDHVITLMTFRKSIQGSG